MANNAISVEKRISLCLSLAEKAMRMSVSETGEYTICVEAYAGGYFAFRDTDYKTIGEMIRVFGDYSGDSDFIEGYNGACDALNEKLGTTEFKGIETNISYSIKGEEL